VDHPWVGAKKKAGGGSAGLKERASLLYFDGRTHTFRAKHLGLFALAIPDGNLLEIGAERSLSGPF
jgi:hypothetical protein